MNVTARMVCESITDYTTHEDSPHFNVVMRAITNGHSENNNYSKYTPTGKFEITVTNPELYGHFKPGKVYDFVITEHEKVS